MNRAGHHLVGLAAGIMAAPMAGGPVWQQAAAIAVTTLTAGGGMSPDVDQTRAWRFVDRWVPDEVLGHQGPMRHRGISHWWGWPVVGLVVAVSGGQVWWGWLLLAASVGWVSHLLGDVVFGASGFGRGAGVPLWPWWGHVGVGFRSGGRGEVVAGWCLVVGSVSPFVGGLLCRLG